MSKELEAFYELFSVYFDNEVIKAKHGVTEESAKERYDIIETALKDYEQLKSRENNVLPIDEFIGDLGEHTRDEVAMKLKALEIIKDKIMPLVNLDDGELCECHYRVYDNELYGHTELTKEEYDLLKEIQK